MIHAGSRALTPTQDTSPQIQGCGAKEAKQQSRPELPRQLRKEIAAFALSLKRDYRAMFASDPIYRKRAGQFLMALLPPKPRRRGRPGRADVTNAIRLLRLFKRQNPHERPAEHWARIYPVVIRGYPEMNPVQQRDARERLRERVRWRLRNQRYSRNMSSHIRLEAKRNALDGTGAVPFISAGC
jgi:hypothetical protein